MEEIKEENEDSFNLPDMLRVDIYHSILEEMLNKLFILQRLSNEPKIKNIDKFPESTISKKNIQNSDTQRLERAKRNVATFEKKYEFIENTLKQACEELKTNGTYKHISDVVAKLNKSKEEAQNLKIETAKMQAQLEKLKRTLDEEEEFYHRKIAGSMCDIGKIKDEIEDFLVESEIKFDYIEKWQNSKEEMTEILLERKEEEKMTALKKLDSEMYKETRVHQEVIAAYNEMEKDIYNEISDWQERYKKDYNELEEKILSLKEKREKQNEATRILRETYLKRQKEIDDYKLYKVQQEEKQQELRRRHEAATKIQAWWRGTMVRKGFGKFRKKKDKKGKKKGADKK